MTVTEGCGGVHPKMAAVLDGVFEWVEKVGMDIGKHKQRKTSQRTWKDSTTTSVS